ncbi:MAG: thioredoxin-like domain-containing protein [Isosphaeraceae bacterium]|nr:thioredoxin-like domain-containing protein [Isosphaeraceae bacterium]
MSRSLSRNSRRLGPAFWAASALILGLATPRGPVESKEFRILEPINQLADLSLEGGIDWINTDRPIHLEKLRGKIVLLDFWTYCCINCHHVLPDLLKLEEKYKNQLVVIGVHTAKFPNERITDNIRKKVNEYKIKHPVVNDANQVIWNRFGVNSWPTIVLLDAKGRYLGHASGEGHGEALDRLIGQLVAKHKAAGELDETPVEFPAETIKTHKGGLLYPGKITVDAEGKRLFITDTGHNRIVVVDLDGKLIDIIGNGGIGLVDGDYAKATFERPQGTCLVDGILYVADTENHAIRAVDLAAKTVKTAAGTGKQAYNRSVVGKGTEIGLNSPWDLHLIPGTKTLAVAMAGPHQIWKYDIAKGTVGSWLGSGVENIIDGSPTAAAFAQPSGLADDGQRLYVADSEVSGIRMIELGKRGTTVRTVVGVDLFGFGDVDGVGDAVRLQHCLGVEFGDGKLFIADTYNNKIKICTPAERKVESFLGTGKPGLVDSPAQFDEPGGLAFADGVLYVADTNNHAVRKIDVATKKVTTLDLSAIQPPRAKKEPTFARAATSTAAAVEAAPGTKLELRVTLDLPEGYKLSAEAPLVYKVAAEGAGVDLTGPGVDSAAELEKIASPLVLPIALAKAPEAGAKVDLKVSLSAFVCLPNTLCTIKNYVVTVPVTFKAGAPAQVEITVAGATK